MKSVKKMANQGPKSASSVGVTARAIASVCLTVLLFALPSMARGAPSSQASSIEEAVDQAIRYEFAYPAAYVYRNKMQWLKDGTVRGQVRWSHWKNLRLYVYRLSDDNGQELASGLQVDRGLRSVWSGDTYHIVGADNALLASVDR